MKTPTYDIGDKVYVRTTRYDYLGEIAGITLDYITLIKSCTVYRSGGLKPFLGDGVVDRAEAHPPDDPLDIQRGGTVIIRWSHDLPQW